MSVTPPGKDHGRHAESSQRTGEPQHHWGESALAVASVVGANLPNPNPSANPVGVGKKELPARGRRCPESGAQASPLVISYPVGRLCRSCGFTVRDTVAREGG